MGTNATINPILLTTGLCILASIVLAIIGFALRSRGKLREFSTQLAERLKAATSAAIRGMVSA